LSLHFIHFIIAFNAQTKIQNDAMVYLCHSEVLLIFFKRDQSHVMINGDAHIFKGDNSSLYSSLQYEYYNTPGVTVHLTTSRHLSMGQ
jgi:Fe-S cluster assembly ATPase SufC